MNGESSGDAVGADERGGVPGRGGTERAHPRGQGLAHLFEVLDPDGEPVDEITPFQPGDEETLAVELDPGTYTLQCILETDDGETHADLGMITELEVT